MRARKSGKERGPDHPQEQEKWEHAYEHIIHYLTLMQEVNFEKSAGKGSRQMNGNKTEMEANLKDRCGKYRIEDLAHKQRPLA